MPLTARSLDRFYYELQIEDGMSGLCRPKPQRWVPYLRRGLKRHAEAPKERKEIVPLGTISAAEFDPILRAIGESNLPQNSSRCQAGYGRSLSFGTVKRPTFLNNKSLDDGRYNKRFPELYKALCDFGDDNVPFEYSSIVLNVDYNSKPHYDVSNRSMSFIVGFGKYTGGKLAIGNPDPEDPNTIEKMFDVNIRHRPILFDGSLWLHWTEPWEGERCSLIYFRK